MRIVQHLGGQALGDLAAESSTVTRWEMSITTPMSCSIIITVIPYSR